MGLLLLRLAVAAALMFDALEYSRPMLIVAAGIALSLSLGLLSTITALLVVLMQAAGAVAPGIEPSAPIFVSIAQSLALALLGPGAYSVDARLFGRRLIFESRRPR